jgi:hypothetical protein
VEERHEREPSEESEGGMQCPVERVRKGEGRQEGRQETKSRTDWPTRRGRFHVGIIGGKVRPKKGVAQDFPDLRGLPVDSRMMSSTSKPRWRYSMGFLLRKEWANCTEAFPISSRGWWSVVREGSAKRAT